MTNARGGFSAAGFHWVARAIACAVLLMLGLASPTGAGNGREGGGGGGGQADGARQPEAGGARGGGGGGVGVVPAARAAHNVAVITINGEITRVSAYSFSRRLDRAVKAGADAIVVELDTPGGELGAMTEITGAIKRCPVKNIVAWVNPSAYSAGAAAALACREIVVSDAAAMGDAAPIRLSMGLFINQMSETERQKLLAPMLAEFVDSARRNGYDEKLVQGMVSLGVELWLVREKSTGRLLFIDREEYGVLFGAEPTGGSPTLVSASPKVGSGTGARPGGGRGEGLFPSGAGPASGAAGEQLGGGEGNAVGDRSGAGRSGFGGGAGLAPAGSEENRFVPAAPELAAVEGDVSTYLEVRSARPVLAAADAGKWELLEYACDGRGLVTMRDPELVRWGFAQAGPTANGRINTDAELLAFFGAQNLRRLDQSWSESMVGFLTNPIVRGVLIVVFLISLFVEMTHPGLILPGTVAALSLVTLLAPPFLMGMANWWEIAAILVGILLVFVEVFVLPGFGVCGIAGVVLLFGGLVGTFVPKGATLFPDSPEGQSGLMWGVLTIIVSSVTSGTAIYYIAKHFGSLPLLGALVLRTPASSGPEEGSLLAAMQGAGDVVRVGATGVTITPLRPAGRVEVGGRIVDAVSDLGFVEAGSAIRVVEVSAMRTVVEAIRGAGGGGKTGEPA